MGLFGKRNWNYHGFNTKTKSYYDEKGFDVNGFNKEGIHKKTNTKFDEDGNDVEFFGTKINKKTLSLTVFTQYEDDIGTRIARIDKTTMDTLNISPNDILEIKGDRRTIAKCFLLRFMDDQHDEGIIRIGKVVQHNAGIRYGDTVSVRKLNESNISEATKVILESLDDDISRIELLLTTGVTLADFLENRLLIKGNIISVHFFNQIANFQVLSVTPVADTSIVTRKTIFHIGGDYYDDETIKDNC
jgi:hypothetical protein